MNYRYSWILLAAMAGTTMAQNRPTRTFAKPERWHKGVTQTRIGGATAGAMKAAGDVVFAEDFANGLAGNNGGVGPWTTSGPNGGVWLYDTDGPNGDFSDPTERIESTTVSNGFMMFDSNFFNNGCTNDCVSLDGYLESPVLNLPTSFVHLVFEQRVRWCCSTFPVHFVDVSTDGGNTWPTRLAVIRDNQFANDDVGTYSTYVNLHDAVTADPTNVKIRFAHEGSAEANGMTHYHWQIDDLNIVESQSNDVDMKNPAFNAYNPDTDLTDKAEFNIYPLAQVHEFTMGSPVRNEGSNPAINVVMHVDITKPDNSVENLTASQAVIDPAVLDSSLFVGHTPDQVGDYSVALSVTMDSTDSRPIGNTGDKEFEVSQHVYAQDEGARDGFINNPDGDDLEFLSCNFFWMETTADVYAIQVALAGSGNTQVGGEFDCTILDGDLAEIATTNTFTVSNNNQLSGNGQGKFQAVMFDSPVTLDGGQEVCVCLHYYGGGNKVAVASSGPSLLGQSIYMDANVDGSRFLELASPMVRMNFDPSVGIEENDYSNGVGMGQNFPNPSKNITTIPYELTTRANVTFEVHDLSGKLIISRSEGVKGVGSYRFDISTADLNEGVYFYTLNAGGVRLTKRMTVIR